MKNVDKLIGLKEPTTRQQGERKKNTMGLAGKTTTLHVQHTYLYMHFFAVIARLRHEIAQCYVLCKTQTSNDEILFLFLNLDIVP